MLVKAPDNRWRPMKKSFRRSNHRNRTANDSATTKQIDETLKNLLGEPELEDDPIWTRVCAAMDSAAAKLQRGESTDAELLELKQIYSEQMKRMGDAE